MDLRVFEHVKKINQYHQEYRKARELAKILEYKDFGNFENVIAKAKIACSNSWYPVNDHFGDITEMVQLGLWTNKSFPSYALSRYACYLIMQNADPSKKIVALWQTYFALQTRKQELHDQYMEDSKRVYLREEMKTHNKKLMSTAKEAWVRNYASFTDAWYMWLYGWMRQIDIHKQKKLKKEEKILDHMNSEELAANLFRTTQTDAKIQRESIKWQEHANVTHFEVWRKIRKTIQEIWGTMPEKLPTTDTITEAKKRIKKQLKLNKK